MTEHAKAIDLPSLRSLVPNELFELPRLRAVVKALSLTALLAAALAVGTGIESILLRVLLGIAMGPFLFALASLGHESGHLTASRWRFVNDLIGLLTMSAIGIPARGWKLKHDLHHKYGGVAARDTDSDPGLERYIARSWIVRQAMRLFNSVEFLFWWAAPFSLWVTTWVYAFRILLDRAPRHRRRRLWTVADLVLASGFFGAVGLYAYTFGWLNLALLIGIPFGVSGVVASACFVPNHRLMPPLTADQARRPARYAHLNSRTVLYPKLIPANFFMNHVPWQIEHHIFPTMAGHRLRELSPHLRAYADREGISLAYESVFAVMPRMLSRRYLWGEFDGKLYTYREAEAIRRSIVRAGLDPASFFQPPAPPA